MQLSIFKHVDAPEVVRVVEGPWVGLIEGLGAGAAAPPEIPKSHLPLWSPATYSNRYRKAANVEAVYALVLDIDEDPIPTKEAIAEVFGPAGPFGSLRAFVHTSSSSTAEAPRWRGIIELSRPVTAAEYRTVWAAFTHRLPFKVGQQSKDPSRAWFVPRRGVDGYYDAHGLEGDALDVDALLDAPPPAPVETPPAPAPPANPIAPNRRALAATLLGTAWPTTGRHAAQLALAGALKRDGWSKDDALEFLCDVCRAAGDEDRAKRQATVDATWSTTSPTTGWSTLGAHVDRAALSATRDLIAHDADDRAKERDAIAEVTARVAQSAVVPKDGPGDALPPRRIDDEHFSARIKRGMDWMEPYVRPPYLLEGLIPRETVTTFFAEGGSVKSWAAFALALSVATETPWLGSLSVAKGKALILDYEDGWGEYRRRREKLTKNIVLDLTNLEYLYAGPNICDEEFWKWLAKQNYTLITIDALNAAMPSQADENDQRFAEGLKLAGRFVEWTGCNVVAVHHANKMGGMRGASTIRDQSDVVFKFESVSETDTLKRMRMVCDKPGPQKRPPPVNVELSDEAGLTAFKDDVHAAGRNATKAPDAKAAILLALSSGPLPGYIALAKRTGLPERVVREALKEMKEAGDVIEVHRRLHSGTREAQWTRICALFEGSDGSVDIRTEKDLRETAAVSATFVAELFKAKTLQWSSSDVDMRRLILVDHDGK